jgi:hypothetical protein
MKPIFSRETVVERRQPFIRWSAVLAGAALALGLWNLLNLVFVGGALTAIDPDEIDHIRAFGIGTGIGSVLAPLIAMFIGGLVAGRLAGFYDDRVTAGHGAVVWAISSVLGLVIMAVVAGSLADKRAISAHANVAPPAPGAHAYVEDHLRLMNQELKAASVPTVGFDDFLDASRYAAGDGRAINRDAFISRLDANTKLSRPEAQLALDKLGPTAPDVIASGRDLALHRHAVMEAAESTGNGMLAAGVGLFLCLVTSVAGSVIGARVVGPRNRTREYERPDTLPGHPTAPVADPYTPAVE